MPNLALTRKRDVSSYRKIAIGTWRTAYDPQVYGTLALRVDEALRYIESFRATTGKHLTISHLLAKAVAEALRAVPDANAVMRFRRIYLRRKVGVFFQVVMTDEGTDKIDLSGATVLDADQKSLAQIVDELDSKVRSVRARTDRALESTRKRLRQLPEPLMHGALRALSFCSLALNLDLTRFGIPNDAFGSVMITNVGTLGLDGAYVPLSPFSGVPIVLALGAVKDEPVVDGGVIRVAKCVHVHATFDHRVIDGFHAAAMAQVVRDFMEHPFERFERLPRSSSAQIFDEWRPAGGPL